MPYYPDIHTLFLHIPKTGGTTVEECLKKVSRQTLYSDYTNSILPGPLRNQSLQHLPYSVIKQYQTELNLRIDDDLKIITIVRNPYNRIVSDLFFFKLIDSKYTMDMVEEVLNNYIPSNKFDNHNIPQYLFIVDNHDTVIKNINIMRNENLNEDLRNSNIIYDGIQHQVGSNSSDDYMTYLNRKSLDIINEVYHKDFELFGYTML